MKPKKIKPRKPRDPVAGLLSSRLVGCKHPPKEHYVRPV